MQLSKILLTTVICLLVSFAGNTQERVKNRAENKANQRVDQKVDEAVNKTADAIEGLFRRKKKNQTEEETTEGEAVEDNANNGGFLSGLGLGGEFEPYENPVKMNLSLDMVTTDKRGKEESMTIHYTFDTWATGMEIVSEESTATILMDNQEGKMTMITEDDGELQGVRMRQPQVNYEDVVPDQGEFTITDLGNTKVINGYNCREYLIEHEDGTTNAWLTTDLEIDRDAIIRAMSAQMRQKKNNNISTSVFAVEGFPIESTTVSKNGKETVKATYYNLKFGSDIDLSVFDTGDIEIMDMGF